MAACARIEEEYWGFYRRARPSIPDVRVMHVPRYPIFGLALPAALYRVTRPGRKMTDAFARDILRIAAETNGHDLEWLKNALLGQLGLETYAGETTAMALKIVAESALHTSNAMDYVSDLSGNSPRVPVERMEIARENDADADDCEGVAKEVQMPMSELRDGPSDPSDVLLTAVSAMLKKFVIAILTGMATDIAASKSTGRKQMICHIWSSAIPRARVLDMLPKELARTMIDNLPDDVELWETQLPVLILEGTAPCNPLLLPVCSYVEKSERRALEDAVYAIELARENVEEEYPSLKRLTTQIQQANYNVDPSELTRENASGFYREVVAMWADLREYGISEIDFSVGWGQTPSRHEYGMSFASWIRKDPTGPGGKSAAILPAYRVTEEHWRTFARLLSFTCPIPSWGERVTETGVPALKAVRSVETKARGTNLVLPWLVYRTNRTEKITPAIARDLERMSSRGRAKIYHSVHHFSRTLQAVEIRIYAP
jgi:hypothetical protein